VLGYLSGEDPDMNEVDNIIMQDPVLAGTLLRYANSPLYRGGVKSATYRRQRG